MRCACSISTTSSIAAAIVDSIAVVVDSIAPTTDSIEVAIDYIVVVADSSDVVVSISVAAALAVFVPALANIPTLPFFVHVLALFILVLIVFVLVLTVFIHVLDFFVHALPLLLHVFALFVPALTVFDHALPILTPVDVPSLLMFVSFPLSLLYPSKFSVGVAFTYPLSPSRSAHPLNHFDLVVQLIICSLGFVVWVFIVVGDCVAAAALEISEVLPQTSMIISNLESKLLTIITFQFFGFFSGLGFWSIYVFHLMF